MHSSISFISNPQRERMLSSCRTDCIFRIKVSETVWSKKKKKQASSTKVSL